MGNFFSKPDQITKNSRGISRDLWKNCPREEIMFDNNVGYYFKDDFVGIPILLDAAAAGMGGYITDQDTGVTIAGLETTDAVGGVIEIANNDADNDFGHLYLASAVSDVNLMSIASGEFMPFWFEARIKVKLATDNSVGIFVGLGETGLITTDGGALVDDTAEVKDENFIGFQILNADGDSLVPCFKADGQTKVTGTASAVVADTWFKCGLYGNGSTVDAYVDGVKTATLASASVVEGTTFPSATNLTLMMLTKTGAAVECAVEMDWWEVFVEDRAPV